MFASGRGSLLVEIQVMFGQQWRGVERQHCCLIGDVLDHFEVAEILCGNGLHFVSVFIGTIRSLAFCLKSVFLDVQHIIIFAIDAHFLHH